MQPAMASSCERSRRSSASTACWRTSSAAISRRRRATAASRASCRCSRWKRRLDNVLYRLGLATSRAAGASARASRALHWSTGSKVDIPSYAVRPGDEVGRARRAARRTLAILHAMDEVKGRGIPEWLTFDGDEGQREIGRADTRADQPAGAGAVDRRVVFEVRREVRQAVSPRLATRSGRPAGHRYT